MTSIVTQIFEENQLEIKVNYVNYRLIKILLFQIYYLDFLSNK
jgi:hypothetical protein